MREKKLSAVLKSRQQREATATCTTKSGAAQELSFAAFKTAASRRLDLQGAGGLSHQWFSKPGW